MTSAELASVVAIPVTPYDAEGAIEEQTYRDLVRLMVEGGITVLTPSGNTGEFYSLTPAERRRVVELTREAAPGQLVVAGVGLDPATAAADARAAAEAGADHVMVHQPVHPYRSMQGWVDYHAQVAAAVPDLGVVPYVKDDQVDAAAMTALAAACPNLRAVKYAVPDPARFAGLVRDAADLDLVWLCGLAEYWAPFFAAGGAQGFTSGLATLDPQRSLRLHACLAKRDIDAAMQEWAQVRRFEELRARRRSQANVSVVKEALCQLGHCRRDVRPPITPVTADEAREILEILEQWT